MKEVIEIFIQCFVAIFIVLAELITHHPLLITSLAMVLFAYLAYCSNKETLRLGLFEKRLDLYHRIFDEVSKYVIHSEAHHDWDFLQEFMGKNRGEILFLFNKEIVNYIDELQSEIVKINLLTERMREIRNELNGCNVQNSEYTNLKIEIESKSTLRLDTIASLSSSFETFAMRFDKYLNFSKIH